MKITTLFALLLLAATLAAQTAPPKGGEKGATPIPPPLGGAGGATRAVVVGISDYQDPGIPDLRFADRDAEAFAAFLKGPGGGHIPEENVRLLTNKGATLGQLVSALTWLIEESAENDQAILYFSGHGDVESRLFSQAGYLLCHDTPAQIYMAGGLAVNLLQDIVAMLSLKNKARVLLITDACRAGKLAGSEIGGAQLTNANLAQRFANEIKLLSCQPNEQSLEGEQWGGGRGVFSFHLVNALQGLADQNADGTVTLLETIGYLQQKVSTETAPVSQVPLAVGNLMEKLSSVDAATLAALRNQLADQPQLARVGMRGLEHLMASLDSTGRALVVAFEQALEDGRLMEPAADCASAYYDYLIQTDAPPSLCNHLRRNLAAALHDEIQQALNAILEADPAEVNKWKFSRNKYALYPAYLERAINLLGEEHYMYKTLRVKQLFFESYNLFFDRTGYGAEDYSSADTARQMLKEALQLDSTAAYLHYLLGNQLVESHLDSAQYHYQRAIDLSPRWVLPYADMAWHLQILNITQARATIEKAVAIRPDAYMAQEMLAWIYQRYDLMDSIEAICARMRRMRPDLANDLVTLGYSHLHITKDYHKAIAYLQRAMEMDSATFYHEKATLAACHLFTRNPVKAFKMANSLSPWESASFNKEFVVDYYKQTGQYKLADSTLRAIPELFSFTPSIVNIRRAECLFHIGLPDSARALVQQAFLLDTTVNPAAALGYSLLGAIAARKGDHAEAERQFQYALHYRPEIIGYGWKTVILRGWCMYGDYLLSQKRFEEAEAIFQAVRQKDPGNYLPYYGIARLLAAQGQTRQALDYLEQALDRWYPIPGPILEEPLFKKLRKTKRFKTLMKKHFPDQVKD